MNHGWSREAWTRTVGVNRNEIQHEPVLCDELMSLVSPQPGETVVDATIGHGGHARLMAEAIGPEGRLIGFDVDPSNIDRAAAHLAEAFRASPGPHIELIRANFGELEHELDRMGIDAVDVILADLGVSTDQIFDVRLGLSFGEDGPLDMRLDDRMDTTAADLVNALPENELADLIFHNAQERFSRRIAKRICQVRREGRITRTAQLVRVVCSALGVSPESHRTRIHPATRTFLALRIAVNRERENLEALLDAAPRLLKERGRIAAISFHSGEDGAVKRSFLDQKRSGVYEIVTKKPIRPLSREMSENPRSRSAKLRVAMRAPQGKEAA